MKIEVKNERLAAMERGIEEAKRLLGIPRRIVLTPSEAKEVLFEVRELAYEIDNEMSQHHLRFIADGFMMTRALQTFLQGHNDQVLNILNAWYKGELKVATYNTEVPVVIERQTNDKFPPLEEELEVPEVPVPPAPVGPSNTRLKDGW